MKIYVTGYPYAITEGEVEIPDGTTDIQNYLFNHFDEIKFGEPDLDYGGTDFDWEVDEG